MIENHLSESMVAHFGVHLAAGAEQAVESFVTQESGVEITTHETGKSFAFFDVSDSHFVAQVLLFDILEARCEVQFLERLLD